MTKRTIVQASVFLTVLTLMIACGESKEEIAAKAKQREAVESALKALRKIDAASEVGVNYQQYGQLVIEAKAAVNDAEAKLPDGDLKKELSEAMDAYVDGREAWGETIENTNGREYGEFRIIKNEPIANKLVTKYGLKSEDGGYVLIFKRQEILPAIWASAKMHLDRASKLLEANSK